MKIMILLLVLLCAGCKGHEPTKTTMKLDHCEQKDEKYSCWFRYVNEPLYTPKAIYVKNPSHHCVEMVSQILKSDDLVLGDDGKVRISYGWRSWDCDGKIMVTIYNDEEQP